VLEWEDEPEIQRLNDALLARFESMRVGNHHVVFFLGRPRARGGG
jgi:hypothetical protein